MPNVLSPTDLVSRHDNMDETVLHTHEIKFSGHMHYFFLLYPIICLYSSMQSFMKKLLILGVDFDQYTYSFDFSFDFCQVWRTQNQVACTKSAYKTKTLGQRCYYAPNFEKVGSILVSACPSVRACVRPSVRSKKKFKLGS